MKNKLIHFFLLGVLLLFRLSYPLSFGSTEIIVGAGRFLNYSYSNVDIIESFPQRSYVIDLYMQYLFDAKFFNIGGEIGAIRINNMIYYGGYFSPVNLRVGRP